jgi:hypothetical protein
LTASTTTAVHLMSALPQKVLWHKAEIHAARENPDTSIASAAEIRSSQRFAAVDCRRCKGLKSNESPALPCYESAHRKSPQGSRSVLL